MKIILQQDEWYPIIVESKYDFIQNGAIEVPDELVKRWKDADKAFWDAQNELAQLVEKWEEANNKYYF